MNTTPTGERPQIGFFGCRNAGKSSLFNAVTAQQLAVVSDIQGTTTDPVIKNMELLPLGPVTFIDTPGFDDDSGTLGQERVKQAYRILRRCDLALLVCDASRGMTGADKAFYERVQADGIACIVVYNKSDLAAGIPSVSGQTGDASAAAVSALHKDGIDTLKERIVQALHRRPPERPIAAALGPRGASVVLVVPIDKAAPQGRLILPQQQTIRDLLDHGDTTVVVRDTELAALLQRMTPDMVITDSQAFAAVAALVPQEIPLTSFSILLARHKGVLDRLVAGARVLDTLRDGDRVLIAEGCTHHRQCEDIGTVKLPAWIRRHSDAEPAFEFSSGTEFPKDITLFRLIIHCGGCMLNAKEMQYRERTAREAGVPMTNYGTAIAHMHGILERSLKPLRLTGAP